MESYRFIDSNGVERSLDTADSLVEAIHNGSIGPHTMMKGGDARWRPAREILPSAFEQQRAPTPPRRDGAAGRDWRWLAVLLLVPLLIGFELSAATSAAGNLGYAIGHVAAVAVAGVLVTRIPRRLRPFWPVAAVLASVLLLADELRSRAGVEDAITELEGTVADITGSGGTLQPRDGPILGRNELGAAVVRASATFLESFQALGLSLADSFGVAGEPHEQWLKADYYVRPSQYQQVPQYFEAYREYARTLAGYSASEQFIREGFASAFRANGVTNATQLEKAVDEAWEGYARTRPSQDTTYAIMDSYAAAALELHRLLLEAEGTFGVDGMGGLVNLRNQPIDAVVAAEARVTQLAGEVMLRMERAAQRMTTLADSMRTAVR